MLFLLALFTNIVIRLNGREIPVAGSNKRAALRLTMENPPYPLRERGDPHMSDAARPLDVAWSLTSAPSPIFWEDIVSDGTGKYLIAVAGNYGGIYTSNDYGSSWFPSDAPIANWRTVAVSNSGLYAVAAVANGNVYTSSTYGSTWEMLSAAGVNNWYSVNCDSTGQNLTTVVLNGGIYVSSNFGTNWTRSSAPTDRWYAVAASSTGQNLIASVVGGYIYFSSDYGAVWTRSDAPYENWRPVACSSSGQYAAAGIGVLYYNDNFIYRSEDFGMTWTLSNAPACFHTQIDVSDSGQIMVASCSENTAGIYLSTDYGASWASMSAPVVQWTTVNCDSSGTFITAGARGGGIYKTTIAVQTVEPTGQPVQPSSQPSSRPSKQPTAQPSVQPTQPSAQPSAQPTQPTGQPSSNPSSQPSAQPSVQPSQPSSQPSSDPSGQPSCIPSAQPSTQPSVQPSHPSGQPTGIPSSQPSSQPSSRPSGQPSSEPSATPSRMPTASPSCDPGYGRIPGGSGCGVCWPGSFSDAGHRQCTLCPPGTFAYNFGSSYCDKCSYPFTNVFNGEVECLVVGIQAGFNNSAIVLGSLMAIILVCVASCEKWFALSVVLFLPTLDIFSDIYYIMNSDLYFPWFYGCCACLVYAIPSFLYMLYTVDARPSLWWQWPLLATCWWLPVSGDAHGIMWIIAILCQLFTCGLWLAVCVVNVAVLPAWLVLGMLIHLTKLTAIRRVWNVWFRVWSGGETHSTDVEVDTDVLNRCLQQQCWLESLPHFVLLVLNCSYLGTITPLAYVSLVSSMLMVINGCWRSLYYHCGCSQNKVELKDIPVGVSIKIKVAYLGIDWQLLDARLEPRKKAPSTAMITATPAAHHVMESGCNVDVSDVAVIDTSSGVAPTSDHAAGSNNNRSSLNGDIELGRVLENLRSAATQLYTSVPTAEAATFADNRYQERVISQSVRCTAEKSRVLNDWLLYELLSSTVSVEQAIHCVDAMVRDGVTNRRVFESIPADIFTRQYLMSLGIASVGLQQHLLLLHQKLHSEFIQAGSMVAATV